MSSLTIKEALDEASLILGSKKEASILLRYLLDFDEIELILKENEKLTDYKKYQELIQKRLNHTPIEYITNRVSFYSREFFIKEGALIPRPETELLIDKALEIIKEDKIKNIAEIGTGSGIIAIMLALLTTNINITATDISNKALEVARLNIEKFGVKDKIELICTNYLDGIYDKFDMIISNPPYIADGFKLEKELYKEPKTALFGGSRGDEKLKEIIDIWVEKESRYLLCEMGYDQKEPIYNYLKDKGGIEVEFYRDLAGLDRGFKAWKIS